MHSAPPQRVRHRCGNADPNPNPNPDPNPDPNQVEEAHKRNEKLEEKLYGIESKQTSAKLASGLEKAS